VSRPGPCIDGRIALCGCGSIGRLHAGNLAGRADLFYHSRTAVSAQALQARHGGAVASDFDEVLGSDARAVVIATPPELHCSQAVAALEAGKSVLVEKPLCGTPDEIERIAAALEASTGAFLMVAENYYYKPSLTALRRALTGGRIGVPQSLALRKLVRQEATGWKSQWGALLEGGIHFVALGAELADVAAQAQTSAMQTPVASALTSPTRVEAVFPGRRAGAPERHARLSMVYDSGLSVDLHYAWDTPALLRGVFQHCRLVGDEGTITFESNGLYLVQRGGRGPRLVLPGVADMMGYRAMTDDFLSCLAEPGRQPYSNLARARRDLGIVHAAYAHLEGGAQ